MSNERLIVHYVPCIRQLVSFLLHECLVEFWALPLLIPLLQYVNRLGFEICSVNRMNNRTRKLGYVNLNWPRCSARVTESLTLTDGSFCRNQNTLNFRLCINFEFMMCILIVDHQFNRMHPWCSWECMLPGRCSPGKRCHTFWNRNIMLLPILLGKVSCVPKNTLCELWCEVLGRIGKKLMELSRISQKMSMRFIFGVPSWLYTILQSVLWRVLQNLKCV